MIGNLRTCALVLVACGQASVAAAQTVPTSFSDPKFTVRPGDRVMIVDQCRGRAHRAALV